MPFRNRKTPGAVRLTALALVLAACMPASLAPTPATTSPDPALLTPAVSTQTPLVTETVQCPVELVPPTITEVQPAQGTPGSEMTVIGSGGYLRDACGGYIESARTFPLYLDNELAGELECYVNRCQGVIRLSNGITPGTHCLSTQEDVCEFEFQVVAG